MSAAPYWNKQQFIEYYGEREKDKYLPYMYISTSKLKCVSFINLPYRHGSVCRSVRPSLLTCISPCFNLSNISTAYMYVMNVYTYM